MKDERKWFNVGFHTIKNSLYSLTYHGTWRYDLKIDNEGEMKFKRSQKSVKAIKMSQSYDSEVDNLNKCVKY